MTVDRFRFSRALPRTALALSGFALMSAASAQAPDPLAVQGETQVLKVHAEGAQVYECKMDGAHKLTWTFREPIATLMADGKTVGRHYAGPNWEYLDGSSVAGKVLANIAGKTAKDIPWLKLAAAAHHGAGLFADVTTVQRINTVGGALTGPCTAGGAFQSEPYSADYVFWKKG